MDDIFYIELDSDWFNKNDIMNVRLNIIDIEYKMKVLSKPRRKWYHLLLQRITFGLYSARWNYKVKLIK